MFRSYRKTKKEKKKNKTRNFVRVFLSSRKFDTATDDINLPLPRGEGEEEGMVIRAEIYAIALQHSAKTSGEKVGNKAREILDPGRPALALLARHGSLYYSKYHQFD